MNVIAYWPFQDAASAEAVGGSDRDTASDAAHKPTRLLRRTWAIDFSSGSATTLQLESAATILDIYPYVPLRHSLAARSRNRTGQPAAK